MTDDTTQTELLPCLTKNIITDYDCKPIPDRSHDWCARLDYFDGDEAQPIGWGETEEDAVLDLLNQMGEYEDGDGSCLETLVDLAFRAWNTRQPTGVAAEAVLQISDELVDKAVWALLDYGQLQTDEIEEHPYRDWKVERSWTLNIARQQMRTALQAVLADDLTALEKDRKATEAAALKEAASLVPSGSDEWFDNLRPVHWKRMMAVLRKRILALIPPDDLTALEKDRKATEAAALEKVAGYLRREIAGWKAASRGSQHKGSYPSLRDGHVQAILALIDPDAPSIISERERAAKVEGMRNAAHDLSIHAPHHDPATGPEHDIGYDAGWRGAIDRLQALIAATEGET